MNEVSVDVDYLASIPAATMLQLASRKKDLDRYAKLFASTVRGFAPMFLQLEEWGIDISFDFNGYIDVRFTGGRESLVRVWKLLRQNGYSCTSRPTEGSSHFGGFWYNGEHAKLYMNFSSSQCVRVKTGTKLVEQDVYEVQCGDKLAIEELK